jgi:hypothetical protein
MKCSAAMLRDDPQAIFRPKRERVAQFGHFKQLLLRLRVAECACDQACIRGVSSPTSGILKCV